jgi:hypothetical protein
MAKCVAKNPERLKAPQVTDIFSVSNCVSENFADYINYWKHNGYWLFDSPEVIQTLARDNTIDLEGTALFYYEAHEQEFDGVSWKPFAADPSFPTNIVPPQRKRLAGFDVVTFSNRTNPQCSPLSCNSLANELVTNAQCLFSTFEEAKKNVDTGVFNNSEPGPYRIFAVYALDWPASKVFPS